METETKHTPGPWVYRKQMSGIMGDGHDLYGIGYERDNAVWFVAEHANEEDARLISAAPDLLAAAKRVMSAVKALGHDEGGIVLARLCSACALAVAIAKAEGRGE